MFVICTIQKIWLVAAHYVDSLEKTLRRCPDTRAGVGAAVRHKRDAWHLMRNTEIATK